MSDYTNTNCATVVHGLGLVHTDLKPDNILLENDVSSFEQLLNTKLILIDFGSATFDTEEHEKLVTTKYYRAPEIILDIGWSFPCDIWSIGCILVELYDGHALFPAEDDNERLDDMTSFAGVQRGAET